MDSYTSQETGRAEVYVQAYPGPGMKRQVSSDGGGTLIVLDARGQVIRVVDGVDGEVEFPSDMAGLLSRAGARLTLVHNHPASNGLSPYDLAQLEKPGVHAVVAVGHDGSVYVAARGTAFRSGTGDANDSYGRAARAALLLQRRERDAHARAAFDRQFHHVMALALHDARVIEYRSMLSLERRRAFDRGAGFLSRVRGVAKTAVGK